MLSESRSAPWPACPAPFNLAAHVLTRARDIPDRVALQILGATGDVLWRYGQLEPAVLGVAAGLHALGLTPGARILLRLGNCVEFPLAFLGAVAAGFLPVACPEALTGPEVTRLCAVVAPALIVAGAEVALPDTPSCPVIDAAVLMKMSKGPAGSYQLGDPERPAYLVYTSGTTGQPRAVIHAHRAIWARQMMTQGWYELTAADRLLHAGSFNWTFTLGTGLFDPWTAGATALVPGAGVTPDQLPELLQRSGATLFAAAPAIYRQMLKSGAPLMLPDLRHGLTAGEKLAGQVRADWTTATGLMLHEAFGLSECSTFVSSCPALPAQAGCVGYAQPGRRIAVMDASGTIVPRGQIGILAVHRSDPGLFLTYLGAEDETKARFCGDWFLTGDLAEMAADGAIRTLGRVDDMMNAGGFRVAPDEVETAFALCPGAGDVAAVEMALGPGKSVIALFYTGPADPPSLQAHANACLARYKQPRVYRWLKTLPYTANGKLNRRALRERSEVEH